MTKKEKEINRLQIEKAKRLTEAFVCHQYKDYERSIWAANEAAKICHQMAKVRREGIPKRNKREEKRLIKSLDLIYGKSEELFQ